MTRTALRDEAGFTLTELLTTLSIVMTIGLATFALVDFSMRRSGEVAQRVETSQRARMAMDTITRQLRSQVCLSADVEPLLAASTESSATFYVDFSVGDRVPEKRTLAWDPDTRVVTQQDYVGTFRGPAPEDIDYPSEPSRRATVLADVIRERPDGASQETPIFTYYAFNTATPPRPDLELPTPLSATDAARVARIDVAYRALPTGISQRTRASVPMRDQVYVRAADPNDPAPTPTCA